jgi:hypothetical protein
MHANRIAIAANEAYRAGDLDRARQLVNQATELDPSRAALWQQQRTEIAAKRIFAQARAAQAEGDQRRADKLIGDARQLDPRMQMLWDRQLTGARNGQVPHQPTGTAGRGAGRASDAGRETSPQWPSQPAPGPAPNTNSPGTAHAVPRISAPGLDEAAAAPEPQQPQPFICRGCQAARGGRLARPRNRNGAAIGPGRAADGDSRLAGRRGRERAPGMAAESRATRRHAPAPAASRRSRDQQLTAGITTWERGVPAVAAVAGWAYVLLCSRRVMRFRVSVAFWVAPGPTFS